MKKRSKARELVLQGLYAWEVSDNPLEVVLEGISRDGEEDDEIVSFASELLRKTVGDKETLDKDVASVVENWEFERIALVDRLILRLALCELLYFEDIPPKVTINEAIDLAKKFSTAESGRFVNGVLDSLYKKFRKENRIVKRGRGLVEWSRENHRRAKMSEVKIERNPSEERLKELDVYNWPIWTKQVSEFPWSYSSQEICYFLEGDVVVTSEGGEAVEIGKGDLVTFPAGMSCTWNIRKDVKKHYKLG